jgi:AcrR family transcriptional regulator
VTTTGSRRRSRARRGEGQKLKPQILAAAEELLLETGDEEAVSIRAVAQKVGVTPPSIYMHFADKNELIFQVCEKLFRELDELFEASAAGSNDPLESLMLRGKAYVQFGLEHPEHYRIMFMNRPGSTPDRYKGAVEMGDGAFGHLVEAVARAIEAGSLPQQDPLTAAIALWSAAHGITSLLVAKPQFPWPDDVEGLVEELCRNAVRGLAAPR